MTDGETATDLPSPTDEWTLVEGSPKTGDKRSDEPHDESTHCPGTVGGAHEFEDGTCKLCGAKDDKASYTAGTTEAKGEDADKEKEEQERKDKEEQERKEKEEQDRKAKEEREKKEKEEQERKAKEEEEERERKAKEEQEERERKEKEEQEKKAKEEQEERERKAKEEQEERERKEKEEQEKREKEEQEQREREAREKKEREDREEEQRKEDERVKREQEEKAREEQEKAKRAQEEQDKKEKEEQEKKAKEEQEKKAKEEQEKQVKEEQEKKAKEEQEKKAKEEQEKKGEEKGTTDKSAKPDKPKEERPSTTVKVSKEREVKGPRTGNPPLEIKILLIGDTGVGKTNFLNRYINDNFQLSSKSTVGIEFATRNIVMVDGQRIKLHVWDTAGQERYRSITRSYFRGAHAALVLYDNSAPETLESAPEWVKELKDETEDMEILLVGNKLDLAVECSTFVAEDDAKALAAKHGLKFVNASAKTGRNVVAAFESVVESLYARSLRENSDPVLVQAKSALDLTKKVADPPTKKSGGCC